MRTYLAIIEVTAAPFWLRLVVGYRRFGRACRSHRLRLLHSWISDRWRPETS